MHTKSFFDTRAWLAGLVLLVASAGVQAQATRTWVSGVGDDVNPCSRTAPCKTFAGAISKTATGGIINVIDPGAYGTLTITKSITVEGAEGMQNGVLATGTTGFLINGAGIDVVLRNLQINGGPTTTGINGVRFLQGNSLIIDNCDIQGFRTTSAGNGNGVVVDMSTATTARIQIVNSRIYNNGSGNDGGGIRLRSTGAAFVFLAINDSDIVNNNGYGVLTRDGTFTTITDSNISGNTRSGAHLRTTATPGHLVIHDSTINDNGAASVATEGGVQANGANAFVFISGNVISENEMAIRRTSGGHVTSAGDNRMLGNTANGTTDGVATSL